MAELVLVTHNTHWFQGEPFAGAAPGEPNAAVLEALGGVYRALAPDLLALQEIQSEEALRALEARLGLAGRYTPGQFERPYGGAVLVRRGRVLEAPPAPPAPRRVRLLALLERPGAPLRVACVHLPSHKSASDPATAARWRLEETAALLEAGPAPDVILGDLNEGPDGPVAQRLRAQGYQDAAELAGQGDQPTTLGGERLDQIWLAPAWAPRLRGYGVVTEELRAASATGKQALSDHLPVWVRLDK